MTANPFDRAFDAFQDHFPDPVVFGKRGGTRRGASDGVEGVQWNFWVQEEAGEAFFGVNLEGMQYTNWPIANFLQNELDKPALHLLGGELPDSRHVYLRLTRDAWQAAARPRIKERFIMPIQQIGDVSRSTWCAAVEEALTCLDTNRNYRGRATQTITRESDGTTATLPVSPHLAVYSQIWGSPPSSHQEASRIVADSMGLLSPIHHYVTARCALPQATPTTGGELRTRSLAEAAEYALGFAPPDSSTSHFLLLLRSLATPRSDINYKVNKSRFVASYDDGSRHSRFLLSSRKLSIIINNRCLTGIELPIDSKPHPKNASMTNCSTELDADVASLTQAFESEEFT